jgi:hypothetical protein
MDKLLQKENNINYSNKQSALDSNNNRFFFYNNGNYFSFGKDNTLINKSAPNTSSFNIKESLKNNYANDNNSNSFLNKKRKLMTSEELELEQIEREREEVRKMMKKNMALYYRTKSGTTRIVSKIKDDIYNSNNISKNIILNNYLNNNSTNNNNNNTQLQNMNKNITNSYAMNFMKEKGINKINDIKKKETDDKKIENNKNSKPEQIIEIINTDINPVSVNNKEEDKNDNIIDLFEEKEEVDDKAQENEVNNMVNEEKASNSAIKTPNKESSYLTKIKKLGSMSKLSLCNKIQKYTEICQEVLKEKENKEGGKDKKKKEEKKEEKKGKEKNKKISKNKKNNKK